MKSKRPKVYIAGPMRGLPDYNYPKFRRYAEAFEKAGWYVENPVEIGATFGTAQQINDDPTLLAEVLAEELRTLKKCDAIYLLEGWQNSEGAQKELAAAISSRLKIYLEPVVYIPSEIYIPPMFTP